MKQRILAVAAHPDDIEFGCGAILIKEIRKGSDVKILICSLGEAGTHGTPAIRKRESQNAAKLIGASIEFLDFGGDCRIEHSKQNVFALVKEMRTYKPDIVLAPDLEENQHPDHVAIAKITRDAARISRYGGINKFAFRKLKIKEFSDAPHAVASLYYYDVTRYPEKRYDIVIDITREKDLWVKAMECHKSQMKTRRYIDLKLSRARLLGLHIRSEYAMGLLTNDPIHLDTLSEIKLSSRNF